MYANAYMGTGGGISDYYLEVAKKRYRRRRVGRVMGREEMPVVKVYELIKVRCKTDYENKLKQK